MSDCIRAPGRLDKDGYGRKWVGGRSGRNYRAHRWAWIEAHGSIPDGLCVCHHCDNPACINVEHLFLGTHSENMRDMVSKKRHPGLVSGAEHASAKLSQSAAETLRWAIGCGVTLKAAGWLGGVSYGAAFDIKHGLTYKEVA